MMEVRDYIQTNFPGLVLKPSLYDQWDIGIHFELAKGLYQFKSEVDELNDKYFNEVYAQALSLFHDLFKEEDTIFFVTYLHQYPPYIGRSKKKMKVYHHYMTNKKRRFHLKQETLPYLFDDEEDADELCTARFSVECRKQDIRYPLLLKAICNQDFPSLKPRLHNPYGLYKPHIFFINATKHVIFYLYDDRGCEVIARDIETIRPLYEKYKNWVDEYCREEINRRFQSL